jgi:multidrug efflux pump
MAPLEDRSQLNVNVTTQEGATYEFTLSYIEEVAKLVKKPFRNMIK